LALARAHKDETVIDKIEKLEAKYKDISSLIAEIDNIAHSEIGHLFDCGSGEVLTLEKAFEENAIVYFCLQPLAFPAYAELCGVRSPLPPFALEWWKWRSECATRRLVTRR